MHAKAAAGRRQSGVTLLELVIFIVVVSIAMSSLMMVFNRNVVRSVDPVVRVQALEKAQALLAEIMARKFDQNTPTGGIPACDTTAGTACAGIVPDNRYDDVGDYHGYSRSFTHYTLNVAVVEAGVELGLPQRQARRVTVSVLMPGDKTLVLSSYKVNF